MNHKQFISIDEVWKRLEQMPSFRTQAEEAYKPGLSRVRDFCAGMGNPQNSYRTIHVAGTNGKGSLCTTLGAVYRETAMRVGVYTSPHLNRYNERFQINGEQIPDEALQQFFTLWSDLINELEPSYFELATCIAFWWFGEQNVDLAVVETGLGGRLDATNIVTPDLSIITSIDYDHTRVLGSTLKEIAYEKAGIIKSGIPVLVGRVPNEAGTTIRDEAHRKQSPLYMLGDESTKGVVSEKGYESLYKELVNRDETILPANLELVVTSIALFDRIAGGRISLDYDDVIDGIARVKTDNLLPGRFEKIVPHLPWYFDGAHTPEAIEELKKRVGRMAHLSETTLIFALMSERAEPRVVNKFSEFGKKYYYDLKQQRSAKYSEIAKFLPDVHRFPSNRTARFALLQSLSTQLVIFGGSFYFYSTVREWVNNSI